MKKIIILFVFFTFISFISQGQAAPKEDSLNNNQTVFTEVESEAQVAKGQSSWDKFLRKNVDFDAPIFNGAPRGIYTVKIRFVVYADGHIGDFQPITRHGFGMEHAVIRALKKSPSWKPATQNGKLVNSYKVQEVTFMIEEVY